ncbi:MAG: hypothetical protein J6113_05015 [Lachnospiraceae bacterium]|nr:hypothetical protein [Lachnospiraceae bacterium]
MDSIVERLEEIVQNAPKRENIGCSDEEKEKYYNTLEAAEDAFLEIAEETVHDHRWLEPGLLEEVCRLAIKEDEAYVDGEDKGYSNYQDRLPFRLYEMLEFYTIPIPKMLHDEIKRHLPKIRI